MNWNKQKQNGDVFPLKMKLGKIVLVLFPSFCNLSFSINCIMGWKINSNGLSRFTNTSI